MKWFQGSIPDAIQQAKMNKSVFLVYITGEDDDSRKMDETWEATAVSNACESAACVSLKLEAKSDACAQFSQIFPVVCVPSTFFIGNNGVPLEVVGGIVEVSALVEKVQAVMRMHKSQNEAATVETTAPPVSQVEPTTTSASEPIAATSSDGLEERVRRTQSQLERLQAQKAAEAHEAAKAKEVQRREDGKKMAKFSEWKADQQRKEDAHEWKKDRADAKLAREKVRAQIAQDRAERSARYNKEKADREAAAEASRQAKVAQQEASLSERDATRREIARIQFRLPDGSSVTQQFPSSEIMMVARNFISDRVRSSVGEFTLAQTYPRRTFDSDDMQKTMLDLDLAPTAVLVVVPKPGRMVRAVGGGGGGLLDMILAPLFGAWNFLYSMLFGSPTQPRGAYNDTQTNSGPAPSSDARSRPTSSYGVRNRQPFSREDNDEGATWNGNSTQQL